MSEVSAEGVTTVTQAMGNISENMQGLELGLNPMNLIQSKVPTLDTIQINTDALNDTDMADAERLSRNNRFSALTSDLGLACIVDDLGPSRGTAGPRARKGKAQVPDCSTALRCSERSTRYNGFKVPQPSDTHQKISKVKPHVIPSAASSVRIEELEEGEIPPPTPIAMMQ